MQRPAALDAPTIEVAAVANDVRVTQNQNADARYPAARRGGMVVIHDVVDQRQAAPIEDAAAGVTVVPPVLDRDTGDRQLRRGGNIKNPIDTIGVDDRRRCASTLQRKRMQHVEIARRGGIFAGAGDRQRVRAGRQHDRAAAVERVRLLDRRA